MRLARWKVATGSCFLVALLSMPAWGYDADKGQTAVPGTLNYVEGQASMGDQNLDAKAVGSATLQAGQEMETGNGKAEILLTPGVYLRLGSNSSVKMISSGLMNTQVAVNRGEAMLEVDQIYKENNLQISQPGADTRIEKNGLYNFNAEASQVRVFDGKALVSVNDRRTTVKGGHELAFNTDGKMKAQGFNKNDVRQNDDLYRWSSLRSEYLSQANVDAARTYYVSGGYGPGWWGPGWYWDPWFAGFTYLPGSGFFYNPFGWGFYSPLFAYRAPVIVSRGFHHFDGTRQVAIGRGFHSHSVRSFNNMGRMSGFHSGPASHSFSAPRSSNGHG
jgi:hypothetical protein